jgi:hypothetical protein
MTTSRYEESIKELGSQDDTKKLKALRFIKNSVIGNKTKKELYIKLGVVQRYTEKKNTRFPIYLFSFLFF